MLCSSETQILHVAIEFSFQGQQSRSNMTRRGR